jgi:MFS family permease
MDWRNRIGLYGAYFFGVAGIGFTLPYLPLYLGQHGLSDRTIGLISTLAALAGLAQFPIGIWSDRVGRRKPFLVAALGVLAVATALFGAARGAAWLGVLVVLIAENGVCRAVIESLAGAEAATLARPGEVGSALGALRFWKPIGVVGVALAGSLIAENFGVGAILTPLVFVQALGLVAALLIHARANAPQALPRVRKAPAGGHCPKDPGLWAFATAMVLFHVANAPGGVYLGLFLNRDLHAPERLLAYAFVVSMAAWMIVVSPAGALADRFGRRPLLVASWAVMALRLAIVAIARTPAQVIANQALDGAANGIFAVVAAAWVADRLADPRRSGEAQVLVGTCLVLGSALGPAAAGFLIGPLGYRGLFGALAALGGLAAAIIVFFVPETRTRAAEAHSETSVIRPIATVSDLSTVP